jgi:hypothetical protein
VRDDREAADRVEKKACSSANGKKEKTTRRSPRAHDKAFGLSEAIAVVDALVEELCAADDIDESERRLESWARELQRIEDQVASFGHYGSVRRGIVEARDYLAEFVAHTDYVDCEDGIDGFGMGFCWGRLRDMQKCRLPADVCAAAQAAHEASQQKQEGNEALQAGLPDKALFCYDAAQRTIGRHCRGHMDCGGTLRAELLSLSVALGNNTALASIRLAERAEKAADIAVAKELYFDASVAATEVLTLEADNTKAIQRELVARKKAEELEARLRNTSGEAHAVG